MLLVLLTFIVFYDETMTKLSLVIYLVPSSLMMAIY